MTPQTIVFKDVTPNKWQAIRRAFASQDVSVPDADSGTIEQKGVTANFQRYGDTLSVTDKPWLVTMDFVVCKLTAFINSAI